MTFLIFVEIYGRCRVRLHAVFMRWVQYYFVCLKTMQMLNIYEGPRFWCVVAYDVIDMCDMHLRMYQNASGKLWILKTCIIKFDPHLHMLYLYMHPSPADYKRENILFWTLFCGQYGMGSLQAGYNCWISIFYSYRYLYA